MCALSTIKPATFMRLAIRSCLTLSVASDAEIFTLLSTLPTLCRTLVATCAMLVSCFWARSNSRAVRFLSSISVDPNEGMKAIHKITEAANRTDLKGITLFPSGCNPGVPINDKRMYPVYAKACELDIPVLCCVGVPGPRVPMAPQKVELIDEVCWFFPELKFVMRHGADPWTDLAVKLMLKWPNLYYSTSAFAPRYYPKAIIDFANTRGSEKIMYAGYFPMGLSLDRIFADMPNVPFHDDVWPKFLRGNAARVFGLD